MRLVLGKQTAADREQISDCNAPTPGTMVSGQCGSG
jgi:hypothetical protein